MQIHFLTTRIVDASGGAKYDYHFFKLLRELHGDSIKLFDDEYFSKKYGVSEPGLILFNKIYRSQIPEICDCDYLFINSRLYTRLMFSNLAAYLNKRNSTKLVVIHHHNNYMSHNGLMRLLHKFFEMRLLKGASQIIIPNRYVVELIRRAIPSSTIIFLESSFTKRKNKLSTLNNHNLLFVGNVQSRKGIIYGLKAFNLFHMVHPEYKYVIVGKIIETDKYYKKICHFVVSNGLSDSVLFRGRIDDRELELVYSSSDLLLFPSLLEGYGWVMVEAMGHGLPVVAFNNSAMPYTVKDMYNGRIIDNKNWKKMAKELIGLVENPKLMQKLQIGAIDTYNSVQSQDELDNKTRDYILNLGNI